MQPISPNTLCSFKPETTTHDDLDLAQGPAVGIEEDVPTSLFDTATSGDGLKFWPWVNQVRAALVLASARLKLLAPQTPITVSPQLPLEIVMQMFKRMGLVVMISFYRISF